MTRILQVANSLDAYRLSLSLHLFPHRPTFDLFLLFPKRKIATITHFALAMLCYVGGIWKGKLERIVSKDPGSHSPAWPPAVSTPIPTFGPSQPRQRSRADPNLAGCKGGFGPDFDQG
jgi:hypothetical protein